MAFRTGMASISALLVLGLPLATQAQTLDKAAWNAVWDRFDMVLPSGNSTNLVQALKVPVPATWANRDEEALIELQHIASAIPEKDFVIDPSRQTRALHDIYASIVLDVDLPKQNENERQKFLAAEQKYDVAYGHYRDKVKDWNGLWKDYKQDLKDRNEPIDSLAMERFRGDNAGFFRGVQAELDDASREAQKFAPVAGLWARDVKKLRDEISNTDSVMRGIWTYEGSFATLKSIASDCVIDGPGWDTLKFSNSITSQRVRNDDWNGGGGWGGTFFSLNVGAGGSDFSNVILTSTESVDMRWCKLTYIALYPSNTWFDIAILQAIDRGDIALKPDSPMKGKQILGPDGLIPRLVKGAIVVRSLSFEAHLGQTNLNEFRRNVAGSGGVRIGPWQIGGGGSHSEYGRDYTTADGGYGKSTAFSVPAMIAIITEPTVSVAPKKSKDANGF